MQNRKKFHSQIYLLILITLLPVIIGTFVYHYHDRFHLRTTNHGMFVSPSLDVPYLANTKEKKWIVLHVSGNDCDDQCEKLNTQLKQVRIALGKNYERVQVVSISAQDAGAKKLQEAFDQRKQEKFSVSNKIYLIDPIGNLFMFYADSTDPMNVLKDLKKVLEVSQIG